MATLINLTPNKTYKTRENAIKAVEKFMEGKTHKVYEAQTYFIHTHEDGRFFPVFVGERAVQAMLHFHFNVIA
jgi:tRNA(Ile2) C34 agmatinyltransferase TiaS